MGGVQKNGVGNTQKDKPVSQIKTDIYYVVIMIDASHPENAIYKIETVNAMGGREDVLVHNVPKIPGHALYYVVKNKIIESVLSFGPTSAVSAIRGQGTPDCSMKNMCYAFKFDLNKAKGEKLVTVTEEWRQKIISGKEKYAAIFNDTCAETVLQILKPFIPSLPEGRGNVGGGGIIIISGVITPYWLFDDFKKAGAPYKVYPIDKSRYTTEDPKKLIREFVPAMNDLDNIKW